MVTQETETPKKTELWGTFSVRDHLRKRPFVAEVLLYDRLIIPRPPTPEEEKPEAGQQSQVTRWGASGWKPGRLSKLLDILREKDLAIELPWGEQARQDWSNLYHGSDSPQLGAKRAEILGLAQAEIQLAQASMPDQAAYIATGGVIAAYVAGELQHQTAQRMVALAKTPGVPIEPVIAYGSYRKFQREQSVRQALPSDAPESPFPYAMFGWEFFVPEDTDKTDHELLRAACKLASRKDLRETRQSFHYWLKQMHDGDVDPETARADMLKRLKEYRAIVRGSGWKTVARYAAKAAPVVAPLMHLVPGVSEFVSVGGDTAAGGATFIVEWLLPENKPDARARPAALVHEARHFFGKKA